MGMEIQWHDGKISCMMDTNSFRMHDALFNYLEVLFG